MNVLAAASTGTSTGDVILAIMVTVGGLIAYWVPTIVALVRHIPNKGSVIVVNAFLGWTVVGWVVALAMAVRSRPPVGEPVSR